ncbi:MAG TPA: DUF2917 domain-containing protein [Burkholderiaceae bacterium]|jgi:hypothetical protein|nr:DUF2917 domain-containing protein [Burkholderiaceae bacterium]
MLNRVQAHPSAVAYCESPLWELPSGRAMTLERSRHSRWLRLREGRLWLTEEGHDTNEPPQDLWLTQGESLRVPPGARVLIEAWPSARFEVLEVPAA